MKKIIYILCFISIFNFSYSQWKMTDGPGKSFVSAIYSVEDELYIVSGQGFFISTNQGETWEILNKNGPSGRFFISSIIKKENTLFVGSNKGAFISSDFGENWELNNNGFYNNQNPACITICEEIP